MKLFSLATLWLMVAAGGPTPVKPLPGSIVGYYALETAIGDTPAKMAVRITHNADVYAVTFYPAVGGAIEGTDVKVRDNNLTFAAHPHGITLTLNLTFNGDSI